MNTISFPRALGGLLIIPFTVLLANCLFLILQALSLLPLVFPAIIPPTASTGAVALKGLYGIQFVGYVVIIITSIVTIVCTYSKSHSVQPLYIVLMLFCVLFSVVDYILTGYFTHLYPTLVTQNVYNTFRLEVSIMIAVVWIPYFLFSKRVKNTFIN